MTINIRPMLKKDKPALMRILRNTPEFKPAEVAVAEELIDGYLEDSLTYGYYVLISESDSALTGYICYGPTPLTEGTWDIYWMAVTQEKQGQGIGGALLKVAEEKIQEAQGRLAIIETSSIPSYEKTRRFHTGHGYEIIASIPDFYAPGDGKLIMVKRLRPDS
ncbi:MAG: GNAT family N-acetyltransferase [Chloroflexota bacterium]